MTSSCISTRSSKADIVQAAEEYIGDLDDKLTLEKRIALTFKEQRNFLIALLAATTFWEIIF